MRLMFFALILLLIPIGFSISINELMYNPEGSDIDKEWVEIYNDENQSVDLSGWKFTEGGTNHNIAFFGNNSVLLPDEYAVIVQNNETFLLSYLNFSAMLIKSTFSLSNTGENLVLKNKTGHVQDNTTYYSESGGSENGLTIGRSSDNWNETRPTPGYKNIFPSFCDWKVSILSNWSYDDSSAFKIYTEKLRGTPTNVTITKRVEDLEGNIVKIYENSTSKISTHNTLTYSPNFAPGAYLIKSEIYPDCEDIDLGNNFADRMIFVKSQATAGTNATNLTEEKDSSLVIETVYDLGKDEKAQFGQIIRVKIIAYRGDTAKYSVSVYVEGDEKVSKEFKFNVVEKYSKTELTIPIQIMSNCKNKFKNGNYKIIAEGLGEKDEYKIKIYNNTKDSCVVVKEIENKTSTKTTSKKIPEKTTEDTSLKKEEITTAYSSKQFNYAKPYAVSTVVFESSQKKAENLVPYGLVGVISAAFIFFLFAKIP